MSVTTKCDLFYIYISSLLIFFKIPKIYPYLVSIISVYKLKIQCHFISLLLQGSYRKVFNYFASKKVSVMILSVAQELLAYFLHLFASRFYLAGDRHKYISLLCTCLLHYIFYIQSVSFQILTLNSPKLDNYVTITVSTHLVL